MYSEQDKCVTVPENEHAREKFTILPKIYTQHVISYSIKDIMCRYWDTLYVRVSY